MQRSAMTLVGALLAGALLTGCGTSEDEQRHEAFCSDVPDLLQDINANLQAVQSDPESAVTALDDALDQLEAVDPPQDVADEWQRLVTAWTDMRDLLAEADLTDPTANVDLLPELQRLQPELLEAGSDIDQWGRANC